MQERGHSPFGGSFRQVGWPVGLLLALLALAPSALAGAPGHARKASQDVSSLSKACGAAVDSKGDLYASSAGEGKIKVYSPSDHKTPLTEISNAKEPCGLAVTTTGNLYVSESATGEVVRYKPSKYPFEGTPSYGSREVIDSSTKAKGIAVDPFDNRLFVAEGDHIAAYKADGTFEANLVEGKVSEATAVSVFSIAYVQTESSSRSVRYLSVAEKGSDQVKIFNALNSTAEGQGTLKLRRTLKGPSAAESFDFGSAGGALAADAGNGHLFVYDAAHSTVDEFDATGEFLDQVKTAYLESLGDPQPGALAVDRSGGAGEGNLYVGAGATAGARLLAFEGLTTPTRPLLPGLSIKELKEARTAATDRYGNLYVAAETIVYVYDNEGNQITTFEDELRPYALAVDSEGNVYVLDGASTLEQNLTYYKPSSFPPTGSTSYERHEPGLLEGKKSLEAIAVNPVNDHVFIGRGASVGDPASKKIQEFKSAKEGSEEIGIFASFFTSFNGVLGIGVYGANQSVYVSDSNQSPQFDVIDSTGSEFLTRMSGKCKGVNAKFNTNIGVDQSNGHMLQFKSLQTAAREYDAAGVCVAEFGKFSEGARVGIAVDNACDIHRNGKGELEPLDETTTPTCAEFDPANGTAYIAFDGGDDTVQPYDVTAFEPLDYGTLPPPTKYKLTVKKTGSGSGKVTSSPAGIECGVKCSVELEEGTKVVLSAVPDPEMEFEGWTGCDSIDGEGKCVVLMDKAREVTAEFNSTATEKFPLKVIVEGSGPGTVTSSPSGINCGTECSAEFGKGVEVVLTATLNKGSEFIGWSEGCKAETVSPTEGTCTVTVAAPMEVKAKFDVEHPSLTVVKKGTGTGTVTSSPAGIECGGTCSHKFTLNQEVTLTSKSAPNSEFIGWGKGCKAETVSPTEGTCTVTMSQPSEITANFVGLPQAIVNPPQPISYTEATLRGEIDPAQLETEYRFEYLTEEEFQTNGETFENAQRTPMSKLAPTKGFVSVEAHLLGLEEDAAYRVLLRAHNPAGTAEDQGSFETLKRRVPRSCPNSEYRVGSSAGLPDCRAYELVTPADAGAREFIAISGISETDTFNNWLVEPRGPGAGSSITYFTGTLPGFEGSGDTDAYHAERGAEEHPTEGWSTELSSPSFEQSGYVSGLHQEGFSADQRYSLWETEPATFFENTLARGNYVRTPQGKADPECNVAETKKIQGEFELVGCGSLAIDPGAESRFVSENGSHVIFFSKEHLETGAAPKGTMGIYDREAGSRGAEVVSVKPDGSGFGAGENATYVGASEDGSAALFSVGGILYLRRNEATTEITTSPFAYAGISEDGQRVFFAKTSTGSKPASLYACDTETGPCTGTGAHSPTEIAPASIFVSVSPDGSHAFFTSESALTEPAEENEHGEHALGGKRNLYAWDGSDISFIAILDPQDFVKFDGEPAQNLLNWVQGINPGLGIGRAILPARSTPDGSVFVFQSHSQLSAYDNKSEGEIYRYTPGAEVGERLTCLSCDPSGAPPTFDALLQITTTGNLGGKTDRTTLITNVTDDGQLVFFQSLDRLLPEDANSAFDVYEWRAKGAGTGVEECKRTGGCLALISTGQGEGSSYLYGMSADGADVFFETREKLVGADTSGTLSIYDARVEGGIPEASGERPCHGDACQGEPTPPPPLTEPASTAEVPSGNFEEPHKHARCPKGKRLAHGKCVPKRHRHHRHRKRQHGKHHRAGQGRRAAR